MHAIDHLEDTKWNHPDNYGGFSPDGDFIIAARTRDADILTESNWHTIKEELETHAATLGDAPDIDRQGGDCPYVYDWRAGHWACGWIESLMIRQDSPDSLKQLAGEIICALADYPIYSEHDYSERQEDARAEYWQRASMAERVEWCRDAGCSIFAARREYGDNWPESLYSCYWDSELWY